MGSSEIRPLGNFAPTIWGDDLFLSLPIQYQVEEEIEWLKEEVRAMLVNTTADRSTKIDTISCLYRLGLSFHFESEIRNQLDTLFRSLDNYGDDDNKEYDLYTISTQFQVFRQHGYKMSCDAFKKFKDPSGKFMDTLATDVRGMLSLYEASHIRVRGEDVIEEALAFTVINLKRMELEPDISPSLAKQVAQALKEPFQYLRNQRVEARAYISIYEEDQESQIHGSILKLAKLDFNLQQEVHRHELCLVLKWWKDLEFSSKLPYVTDRVVESHVYAQTTFLEPCYSLARIMLAKLTLVMTILDDTCDAFGTFKELQLFTDAINRWDISTIDQLPDNMAFIYTKLLTLLKESQEETTGDARLYGVDNSIERMKEVCRSYYEETKWHNDGYIPKLDDEYTEVANVNILVHLLVTWSCMAMNDIDVFEWLRGEPKILKVTRAIARLQNDLSGHEYEKKRGYVVSSVECYMKHYGVPFEEAVRELRKRIADGLKDLNEECLEPTTVPLPFRKWFTNLIRFTSTIYKDVDGFARPEIIKDDMLCARESCSIMKNFLWCLVMHD